MPLHIDRNGHPIVTCAWLKSGTIQSCIRLTICRYSKQNGLDMMWRKLQSNRWLLVSALVLLPALIVSFAACVLCDSDFCCDDSECSDVTCYCACAFYAISVDLAQQSPVMNANGFVTHGHLIPAPQEPLRDLYRPPRNFLRA